MRPASNKKVGLLLTNLGTPDAPETGPVRRYLAEFLSDPRVVEAPRWFWLPLLYGVILLIRPRLSAKAYSKVWTDNGSPLLDIGRRQAAALQKALGDDVHVALGMRYGNPSIASALKSLTDAGVSRVLLLPLYPQYSASTTATTVDKLADVLRHYRVQPSVRSCMGYHDEPSYIAALAESVRRFWRDHERGEKLMMSFHGIPQRYADKGDPYPDQCRHTAELLAEQLGLPSDRWALTFQSRFGREPWLQPYTDKTLEAWGEAGVKTVDVICPGFSADCLETLEEIAMENRENFEEAGGERLNYIPALNDSPEHVAALARVARRELTGWL